MGTGVVASFDDARGYGTISVSGTGAELFFHCIAIADGSRSIGVGQRVWFSIAPGHLGRLEAREITKAGSGSALVV
jgi:cold shock CspA family protein